jgi:glucose-1-phosphate thymidylyltransferase
VKAVILARGRGTRMQRQDDAIALTPAQSAMADAGMKSMMPFRRPFLDYVLSALADANCRDICIVVGPDDDVIRPYYEATTFERVRVRFAIQADARGTADAVLAVESFAGGEPFLVLNADNYYPVESFRALRALDGPGLPVFRQSTLVRKGNIDPARVRAFAVVTVDAGGIVRDIIEKPDDAVAIGDDPLVSMNCWRFDRAIFEACREIEPSPRGEVELPNAVRHAIRVLGCSFRAVPVEEGVLDLSRRSDIPDVERRLAGIDPRP